jgi:pyruvate dehydrogenase E2 component (dihydrolipoamide acetyltransferase)
MARELGIDLGEVIVTGGLIRTADVKRFAAEMRPSGTPSRAAATPAARRLARELGLDLSQITGTGPRGRIQEDDVKRQGFTTGEIPSLEDRPVVIQPLTAMRRTIAERMQISSQTAPHIALSIDVDVAQFEEEHRRLNKTRARNDAENISMTALLVYVTARVISHHPEVNASYINDQIYLWEDINIGVATAVEGGLVVPVVHHAGELSLMEINRTLQDLVKRAGSGQLSLSEVRGGSFTISNLGMFGIHRFRAIINPPESAILAIGAIVRRPVVINDLDEIGVRPVMNLTLSADHRVLDGVSAARFLNDLAKNIQNHVPLL